MGLYADYRVCINCIGLYTGYKGLFSDSIGDTGYKWESYRGSIPLFPTNHE